MTTIIKIRDVFTIFHTSRWLVLGMYALDVKSHPSYMIGQENFIKFLTMNILLFIYFGHN